MINNRINRIISDLTVPVYLVTSQADLFYLTGIDLEGFWLVISKEGAVLITSKLLAGQLNENFPGSEIIISRAFSDSLREYCRKRGITAVGTDFLNISHALGQKLAGVAELKDTRGLVERRRMIKDSGEIEKIRKACKLAVSALKYARKLLKPGVSEKQIMFKIEEYFEKNGARPAPKFQPIVAFGPNTANPHHISSDRKIKKNDVALIDLGCVLNGYCSDLTRTFNLGKINTLFKEVHTLVKEAHARAVEQVRSGVKASDIDDVARKTISDGGYGANFIHTTGHGIGIEVHESPRLSAKDETVLETGMAVTVEPGIYLPGQFGARHEDLILVKNNGCEVLTDDFNG
jgi:Xaa-Pro aminopeptidase